MPSNEEYILANWAKRSPEFRNAHNRLRVARGQQPIPPPKIDLYVPPKGPKPVPFDPNDKDFIAAVRQFNGGAMPGMAAVARDEGLTINGREISFKLNEQERLIAQAVRKKQREMVSAGEVEEGFRINGRAVR